MSRKKISPDPRGKFWSEDSSKFGQKMLEKMGWSKGKGLGRNEDGQVEHIKILHKDNKKGVGYTLDSDNNWIAHQEDFNSLLTSLQEHHNTVSSVENTTELQSLEERSKKSRSRVHYSKFTRGKDLSRCSQEDLACIIVTNKDGQNDDCVNDDKCLPVRNTNTVNAACNMKEYFAGKLAHLKSSSDINRKEILDSEKNDGGYNVDKTSSNKKIKDKMESVNNDCEAMQECCQNSATVESREYKKKKRKHKERNVAENEVQLQEVPVDEMDECENEKQKKTKKKKHKKNSSESELVEIQLVETSKKHKKKKKR